MSFSNLLTNDFLDHSKASEDFFYTFDFYTCKNYTFESVAVSAHALLLLLKVTYAYPTLEKPSTHTTPFSLSVPYVKLAKNK